MTTRKTPKDSLEAPPDTPDDALRAYRRMRDFGVTGEPSGAGEETVAGRSGEDGLLFVVQKHRASHLHYDFRLEHAGTLKSWAVPKGPSLDPRESRLAVEVEDHPLDYGGFEGTIPAGQYGAGTVLLWDRGEWSPLDDAADSSTADSGADDSIADRLARGKLTFRLSGRKLGGDWHLTRIEERGARAGRSSKPQWILRKVRDAMAVEREAFDVLEAEPHSVLSGLDLEALSRRPGRVWRGDATAPVDPTDRTRPLPALLSPQLAVRVERVPRGDDWLHEIKLDGYRLLARIDRRSDAGAAAASGAESGAESGAVTLHTRGGLDWTGRFPTLARSLDALPVARAWIDGEVVALSTEDGTAGRSDFHALQRALAEERDAELVYFAFDLLHLDGVDLRGEPVEVRKARLAELLGDPGAAIDAERVRLSEHYRGHGRAFYRRVCALGFEGVISKRVGSGASAGRSPNWCKSKCGERQEVVIVGFTEPSGRRSGFGALAVAVHDAAGALRFAGRVGTGFDNATLQSLRERLETLRRADPAPVDAPSKTASERSVRWVEPELVAEVAFAGWTPEGRLRHAVFQGLREDLPPEQVTRERATRAEEPALWIDPDRVQVAGVTITHPDRVIAAAAGAQRRAITKRDLAEYFALVAPHMLPHVARRPLSLLRCPQGIDGLDSSVDCFFQKHLDGSPPEGILPVPIETSSGTSIYLAVESVAGLVALAQRGALELHPWGSTIGHLERPDRLIFDLDPDPDLPWTATLAAAREVRDVLSALGLDSLPLLTGGKGVHLVVPIEPGLEWRAAKALCRGVALVLEQQHPDRYISKATQSARRGKIFVDYLRNGRGATAIAPYSPRARVGLPVAVPVRWSEMSARRPPNHYRVDTLARRLAALDDDPWRDFEAIRQPVDPEIVERLGGSMDSET